MNTNKGSHSYSVETLYHYQCGKCRQWWTIGDSLLPEATCPRCGAELPAEQITPSSSFPSS